MFIYGGSENERKTVSVSPLGLVCFRLNRVKVKVGSVEDTDGLKDVWAAISAVVSGTTAWKNSKKLDRFLTTDADKHEQRVQQKRGRFSRIP